MEVLRCFIKNIKNININISNLNKKVVVIHTS